MSSTTNKPFKEFRIGAVKAAIWPNKTESGVVSYSVTFSRICKDADGNCKSTSSFYRNDLISVAKAAGHAFVLIFALKREEKKAAKEQPKEVNAL